MRKRWQDSSGMGNAGHVGCMRGSAGKHCGVPSWSLSSAVSSESVSPSPATHACSSSYRLGPDRSTWPGARWPSRRFVGRGREGVHRTLLPAPAQIVITICTQVCQEAPAPSGSVPRSLLLEAAGWLHRVEIETVTLYSPCRRCRRSALPVKLSLAATAGTRVGVHYYLIAQRGLVVVDVVSFFQFGCRESELARITLEWAWQIIASRRSPMQEMQRLPEGPVEVKRIPCRQLHWTFVTRMLQEVVNCVVKLIFGGSSSGLGNFSVTVGQNLNHRVIVGTELNCNLKVQQVRLMARGGFNTVERPPACHEDVKVAWRWKVSLLWRISHATRSNEQNQSAFRNFFVYLRYPPSVK